MKMLFSSRSRAAFTFLELIFVAVLVAVLAALLFPTLGKVTRSGKQATCAANVRTFGTAILMLVNDRGELPPRTVDPETGKSSPSNYWGWLTAGPQPYLPGRLRCPLMRKGEEKSNAFNYAGNKSIYEYYPKVQMAAIPAPAHIVPLAMECYAYTTGFDAAIHVYMTLWGTKDGLGNNPPRELVQKREEESRRAQYHGGSPERWIWAFFLDGHVAPFAPVLRDGAFDASAMILPSQWAAMKRRGAWNP